ncbi:MAG: inositol monophosphatase [Burkholderiaceae bacterium]|nr:inositol monophosphatase [Burkholderiaceae bacterium]
MNPKHSKIEALKQIALDAGAIVREGYFANKTITHKGTVDLVTQYDVATEQFILPRLAQLFPEYTLVGEESHQGNYDNAFERVIYIDPIDGTTNFIHGVPHVAVSIGVYERGIGVMGVVYNPILDELFWAVAGAGAYLTLNDTTTRLQVSAQSELQQSLIATGFPYSKVNQGEAFEWVLAGMRQILPNCRDIRRLGSAALDLCYVARGTFDGYYEIALKPWDYAAGVLIAQEAGALITDVHGALIEFSNNSVIAANSQIHAQILTALHPV